MMIFLLFLENYHLKDNIIQVNFALFE